MDTAPACVACGQVATYRCSKCQDLCFCSQQCAQSNPESHRAACRATRRAARERVELFFCGRVFLKVVSCLRTVAKVVDCGGRRHTLFITVAAICTGVIVFSLGFGAETLSQPSQIAAAITMAFNTKADPSALSYTPAANSIEAQPSFGDTGVKPGLRRPIQLTTGSMHTGQPKASGVSNIRVSTRPSRAEAMAAVAAQQTADVPAPTSIRAVVTTSASAAAHEPAAHAAEAGTHPRDTDCYVCDFVNVNELALDGSQVGRTPANETFKDSGFLILSVGSVSSYKPGGDYYENWLAWGCYGNRWGSAVRVVDPVSVPQCPKYKDWFFRRLCAVKVIAQALLQSGHAIMTDLQLVEKPSWILHVDGDTIVFNGNIALYDIVQKFNGTDVVLYERFRSGELVAGNYMLRPTNYSVEFLSGWERLRSLALRVGFSNSDNGVLHLQVIQMLQNELQFPIGVFRTASMVLLFLRQRYMESIAIPSYDRYIAAMKLALGPTRVFKHILIQRRGQGICIDNDINGINILAQSVGAASRFLCVHGQNSKDQDHLARAVGQTCVDKVISCRASVIDCRKVEDSDRGLIRSVRSYVPQRMGMGMVNDVQNCWPDCPPNIDPLFWPTMQQGLLANAQCRTPVWGCCCKGSTLR